MKDAMNFKIDYRYIDKECRKLVRILNKLPGICTFSSCCGHGIDVYGICFLCENENSLKIVLESIAGKNFHWVCTVDTIQDEFYLKSLRNELLYAIDSIEKNVYQKYKGEVAYKQSEEIVKTISSRL